VTFHGGIEGQPPVHYQWSFDGALISAATNESYTLPAVDLSNEGRYTVEVTDATNRVVSNPAFLFVVAGPVIVADPVSRTNIAGTAAAFEVDASGDEPLTYQWRRNGAALPGAVATSLILPSVQMSDQGLYDVIVQNDFGSVTSRGAVLVVNLPPPAMRITGVHLRSGNHITLSFDALANQSCTILFAPVLGDTWRSVTNYPAAPIDRVIQAEFPISGVTGFYRLQSP
jgi:hypothetical protein